MVEELVKFHRLKVMPDLAKVVRLEFVNRLYAEKR
jgi:hypothetical protein